MTTDESDLKGDSVEEAAAHWLQVIKENPQARRSAEFVKWASASPEHIVALRRAKNVDDRLHDFIEKHSIDVDALVEEARQEQQRLKRDQSRRMTAALSIAAVGIVVLAFLFLWVPTQTFVTSDSGEEIQLADGSSVALEADSVLNVEFSRRGRDLYLKKGRGNFTVHHDSKRPFQVHAGAAVVEAVGTEFDVGLTQDRTDVKVVKGVVRLKPSASLTLAVTGEPATQTMTLTAGQSLTVHADGRTEWQQLVFENEPLSKIVEVFNRWNKTRQFRIEGARLRERRLLLVAKDTQPETLIRHLKVTDPTLEFVSKGKIITVRERTR
jgi:transmembrane sensor